LREYYDFEQALQSVPTLSMLTNDAGNIKKKGQRILRRLGGAVKLRETIQLKPTVSRVGGGAMPEHGLDSWALVIRPGDTSASELERWFRGLTVPLILRIEDKQMIIDLRTILEDDIPLLIDILKNYLDKGQKN
jgi:L-seryl-tRNA(Ser) seleniumtransferase